MDEHATSTDPFVDGAEAGPDGGGAPDLEGLYRDRQGDLVRLAFLITGSYPVAEEVVQDAFVKLHRAWGQAHDPGPYVRRIVVNEARGRLRRQAVERRHVPPPIPMVLPHEIDETWALLAGLSPRRRVALVLRYYLDLSIEDIADAMECRPATAKSLIHRGLASLRRKLDGHDPRR